MEKQMIINLDFAKYLKDRSFGGGVRELESETIVDYIIADLCKTGRHLCVCTI